MKIKLKLHNNSLTSTFKPKSCATVPSPSYIFVKENYNINLTTRNVPHTQSFVIHDMMQAQGRKSKDYLIITVDIQSCFFGLKLLSSANHTLEEKRSLGLFFK